MRQELSGWKTWQEFRSAQQEIVLPAGTAAHIPVTIRYVDVGEAQRGTILLMHGIPTWGYLYHAIIPPLVHSGYRVLTPDFLGHGWSDRRDRFDRSFQDQARMISTFCRRFSSTWWAMTRAARSPSSSPSSTRNG